MIILAAYTWMIANIFCMLIVAWIGKETRKTYHALYVVLHLCCALWGMTVPAINVPVIRDINAVILPIVGGIAAAVGITLRLIEMIRLKHIEELKANK